MLRRVLLICMAVGGSCGGQESPPALAAAAPVDGVQWLHTEVDAVGWAFDALAKYDAEARPFVRFVYLPPWATKEWIAAVDVSVNLACNHTTTVIRGDRHGGGWLLAYRLDLLAPEPSKRAELVRIWDFLSTRDPRFHVSNVNVVDVVENGQRVQRSRRVALLAPHLEAALAKRAGSEKGGGEKGEGQRLDVLVTQLTRSTGGIYAADFLIEQLLTSRRGLYPEFRQYRFKVERFTPLQSLLRSRGFFAEEAIDKFQGERGALLLHSDVTGKMRVIVSVFGLAGNVPMLVTFDVVDGRTRADEHFARNLIDFRAYSDASELIVPMPCGLLEFVLADRRGNLQRVAPPDVVCDFTKPDGHTKELEMGMSCVMCHFPRDGYRTAGNDLEKLIGSDADFVGDDVSVGGKKLSRAEAAALVAGRFGERLDDPDGIVGRARRDFVRAVDRLTDYEVIADGPSSVQRVGEQIKAIYHGYRYAKIDADQACFELGLRVPAGAGRGRLRTIAAAPVQGGEDVIIALLKNGAEIRRDDFEAVYVELARRVVAYRERLVVEE